MLPVDFTNYKLGFLEAQQSVKESGLLALPTELALNILKYLSNSQDLHCVGLTCRQLLKTLLDWPIYDYQVFRMELNARCIERKLAGIPALPVGSYISLPKSINILFLQKVKDNLNTLRVKRVAALALLDKKTLISLDEEFSQRGLKCAAVFKLAQVHSALCREGGQQEIADPQSALARLFHRGIELNPRGALLFLDKVMDSAVREIFKVSIAHQLVKIRRVQSALLVTQELENEGQQRLVYRELSRQFADEGDFENSVKIASLLTVFDMQRSTCRYITQQLVLGLKENRCPLERAQEIALSMPTQESADWTLLEISKILLIDEIGDLNGSKRFASMIKNGQKKIQAYSNVCRFLISKGKSEEALKIAHRFVRERDSLSSLLGSIAIERCRGGDLKGGLKITSSMSKNEQPHPLSQMASIRLGQGYLGEALYLISLFSPPDSKRWMDEIYQLFNAAVSASRFKEALCLSKMMPHGNLKDMSLKTLIQEAIERLDLQSAIEATEQIGEASKIGAVGELFRRFEALDKR